MTDIWTNNLPLIKKLFQDDRVPLKRLREILVKKYNLPELSPSQFERKIRNELRLRVKFKKDFWERIYLYALSQGYDRGTYSVIHNGTEIRADKVWKEIRRSGIHRSGHEGAGTNSLPPSVQVISGTQTPDRAVTQLSKKHSNGVVSNTRKKASIEPSHLMLMRSRDSDEQDFESLAGTLSCQDVQDIISYVKIIDEIIESLPCSKIRRRILGLVGNGRFILDDKQAVGLSFTHIPYDGFVPGLREKVLSQIPEALYPVSWNVRGYLESLGASTQQRYGCEVIWVLVYIISNQLNHSGVHNLDLDQLLLALGAILNSFSSRTILAIFDHGSVSMRGVWDAILLYLSSRLRYAETRGDHYSTAGSSLNPLNNSMFRSLFETVLNVALNTQTRWIVDAAPVPGILCTVMGMPELAKKLLLDHLGSYEPLVQQKDYFFSAFQLATCAGAFKCVSYLAQHCSLIRKNNSDQDLLSWIMCRLLSGLASFKYDTTEEKRVLHSLKILLHFGVDPGRSFQFHATDVHAKTMSLYKNSIIQTWEVSILDASFYLCRPAFEIICESKRPFINPSTISRIQICTSLEQGSAALEDYLLSLTSCSAVEKKRYVEALLFEQFTFLKHHRGAHLSKVHARIATQLFEYGLDTPASPGEIETIDFMLLTCVHSLDEYGNTDDLDFIFGYLLEKQPKITSKLLLVSIQEAGVAILSRLHRIWQGGDERFGGKALLRAAKYQNFEAVDWLLSRGVDVNLEFKIFAKPLTVIGHYVEGSEGRCMDMVRHMIKSTPSLRYRSGDKDCSRLIKEALQIWPIEYLVELIELFRSHSTELDSMIDSQWTDILRAVLGSKWRFSSDDQKKRKHLQAFDHLARRYFVGGSRPILTYAIFSGCSRELVDFFLAMGANVNEKEEELTTPSPLSAAIETCDFDLAQFLIARGATIDGDAMRAACRLPFRSVKARREKMAFIQHLVGKGMDLKEAGAVSAAIEVVDVDLVEWLLERGAATDGRLLEKACYRSDGQESTAIIRLLLDHGVNTMGSNVVPAAVRACKFDLARWLLERDVEIDDRALREACAIRVATRQDRQEKMALMQSLVERGANVNGESLLSCVEQGDIEATCFLLKQKANPNLAFKVIPRNSLERQGTSCSTYCILTALDYAVGHGFLDVTQLLLKAGAISGCPGLTGYDWALERTVYGASSAVAELMQQQIDQLQDSPDARTMRDDIMTQALECWEDSLDEEADKRHREGEMYGKEYIPPHMCQCVLEL